jgi:SAM-dependent methyltransferase
MDEINEFWSNQAESLNRERNDEYYRKKALEHRSILAHADAQKGALDLGCGAGELIEQLSGLVKINTAVDFSASMIEAAENRLYPAFDGKIVKADVFTFAARSEDPVWMSTGAINQYLQADRLRDFLDIFSANNNAEALYLFDCIDPLRYDLLFLGISYRPEHALPLTWKGYIKHQVDRLRMAFRLIAGRYDESTLYMGSPGMGFGQRPSFWLKACAERGLNVEIISSRYFEYRYHVIIKKS